MNQSEIISHLKSLIDNYEEPITTDEAAKFLKISKSTLFKWTAGGKLPFFKKHRRNFFLKSQLRAWLLDNPVKTNVHIEQDAINYLYSKKKNK